jgi:glycine/D-amino acid oxidase-like deaminating enzyme
MAKPIVVIGSGIVGSAVARQLQARGAQTVMVDDAEPRGASYFSFASLSAFDEPLTEVYAFKCLGMSYWRRWEKELGVDIGLRWDGEIRWAESPEAAQNLREKIARAIRRGYSVESITADELARRLPNSSPKDVLEASFAPVDGQANPRKAIGKLRGAFVNAGGKLLAGRARLHFEGDAVFARVGEHEVEASRVVVAGGAETRGLLERLGWEVPMEPSPGLLVLTEPIEPVLTGTAYVFPADGPAIHLRQQYDDRILIGERSQDYVAVKPTMSHAVELLRQAQRSFPVLAAASVSEFTVEWRPMPRDGLPIIGPLPGFPAMYVATGHSGVTLAPAIAALVAQEIVDGKGAPQLQPFRPARFASRQAYVAAEVESAFNLAQ